MDARANPASPDGRPSGPGPSGASGRRSAEERARRSGGISGGDWFYAWVVRGLEEELARAEAVLDLGCGVGGFGAHLARRFGRKTHGIDLVQHPGFIADAYASFQRLDLDAIEAGSVGRRFDLIFALGVIEYLTDPRALVCAVPHWLGPRGRFVITTPNPASLRSILSLAVRGEFSAFRAVSNPAAITPVLAADASRMFLEAGFDRVEMDYSGRGRPPFLRRGAYQRVVPWLTGRLFSDDYRVIGSINTSAAR